MDALVHVPMDAHTLVRRLVAIPVAVPARDLVVAVAAMDVWVPPVCFSNGDH